MVRACAQIYPQSSWEGEGRGFQGVTIELEEHGVCVRVCLCDSLHVCKDVFKGLCV